MCISRLMCVRFLLCTGKDLQKGPSTAKGGLVALAQVVMILYLPCSDWETCHLEAKLALPFPSSCNAAGNLLGFPLMSEHCVWISPASYLIYSTQTRLRIVDYPRLWLPESPVSYSQRFPYTICVTNHLVITIHWLPEHIPRMQVVVAYVNTPDALNSHLSGEIP